MMSLPPGELSLQAEEVKVVVVADQSVLDHRIQGVHHILPDRLAADILRLLHVLVQAVSLEVVIDYHVTLVARHACGLPCKPFRSHHRPVKRLAHQDGTDSGPDLALFCQGLGFTELSYLAF